jgi:hypothetical protein
MTLGLGYRDAQELPAPDLNDVARRLATDLEAEAPRRTGFNTLAAHTPALTRSHLVFVQISKEPPQWELLVHTRASSPPESSVETSYRPYPRGDQE